MYDKQPERTLEMHMQSRRYEAPSADLAERIIYMARTSVVQRVSVVRWFARLFGEFHLPQPSYALAGMLAVGFALGIGMPLDAPNNDAAAEEMSVMQDLFYGEESEL